MFHISATERSSKNTNESKILCSPLLDGSGSRVEFMALEPARATLNFQHRKPLRPQLSIAVRRRNDSPQGWHVAGDGVPQRSDSHFGIIALLNQQRIFVANVPPRCSPELSAGQGWPWNGKNGKNGKNVRCRLCLEVCKHKARVGLTRHQTRGHK